jgi:hypothetical protein
VKSLFVLSLVLGLSVQASAVTCSVTREFDLEPGKHTLVTAHIKNSPHLEYNVEKEIDLAKQRVIFKIKKPVSIQPPPPPGLFDAIAPAVHRAELRLGDLPLKGIFIQEFKAGDCVGGPIYSVTVEGLSPGESL